MPDTAWMTDALCRGAGHIMFPDPDDEHRVDLEVQARALCAACPVHAECLGWALDEPEQIVGGIVAGLTEAQLRKARRGDWERRKRLVAPR